MPETPPSVPLPPHAPLAHYYTDEAERRRRVASWFDASAADYDWINRVMSLGSGHRYRRTALLRHGLVPGMRHLDVACGTGVLTAHAQGIVGPKGLAVGLDPSTGMLLQAAERGVSRLVRSVAEGLPFPDASFDLLTMGYALRHVADLRLVFREYRRVVKPGGKAVILEITAPRAGLARQLTRLYFRGFVPLVARLGRGGRKSRELMQYYWDTVDACVRPEAILEALRDAGFAQAGRQRLMGLFSEYWAIV